MRGAVIAIAWVAASAAGTAHAACELRKAADLPVTMDGLQPFVPVTINKLETKLLVDTGAFYSTLDSVSAKRAEMKSIMPDFRLTAIGTGGQAVLTAGRAETVTLAGIPLKKVDFLIHERPLTPFAAGLLGQNILGVMDTEYDLAHGAIRIFSAKGCGKVNLAYWSKDRVLSVLPIRPTNVIEPHIKFPVEINGVTMRAMLDSGAWSSVLDATAAARAGVTPASAGARSVGLSSGIGKQFVETWSAPFVKVVIGGEEIRNTRLRVAKRSMPDYDLLLGADFFLSHRIFVSKSQNRIYFTYNGGPVFRLNEPDQSPPQGPAAPVGSAAAMSDADALGRTAAASAARRDYRSAIRDYGSALAAKPDDPGLLRGRAAAYLATKQMDLAARDLDQAIKAAPGHVQARLTRGGLRLKRKDVAGAQADFDAALAAAPHEIHLPLAIAERYSDAGEVERALALYDAWIVAHPKDNRLFEAFNGRCWTRTVWNQDLNLAVADCDAALRRARPNSATLNSRGVLRYRLGQLDAAIADLDASLKLQPNIAWSLYARGLAKARKGPPGAGDADIQAAKALDPDLPEEAERYGLVPA
jgi:tetratricopeptide (TPR) repeat protein/predicted aspartyl protease